MPNVAITQVLGPIGRDQFTAALNAVHPEGGAKIGYYRQLNLAAFGLVKMEGRAVGIMTIDSL
jgi:hypothetical protein